VLHKKGLRTDLHFFAKEEFYHKLHRFSKTILDGLPIITIFVKALTEMVSLAIDLNQDDKTMPSQ